MPYVYIFKHRVLVGDRSLSVDLDFDERRIDDAKRKYVEEHGNVEWLERSIEYILEHPWGNIGATGYF